MVNAGLVASRRGDVAQALALFDAAAALPGFGNVPNGYRRRMALIAFQAGRCDLAEALFDKLVAPMISMCDDETDVAGLGGRRGDASRETTAFADGPEYKRDTVEALFPFILSSTTPRR